MKLSNPKLCPTYTMKEKGLWFLQHNWPVLETGTALNQKWYIFTKCIQNRFFALFFESKSCNFLATTRLVNCIHQTLQKKFFLFFQFPCIKELGEDGFSFVFEGSDLLAELTKGLDPETCEYTLTHWGKNQLLSRNYQELW